MNRERPVRALVAAVVVLFLALWFANLDARRLIRPDEGRYAEIAREMAASGDFVTPRLNGIKYFEKPPLQYWATATAFAVFGPDEWTARLWPALTGVLALLVVWRAGRRVFGEEAGDLAGIIGAGMLWMAANGHLNSLDMGLAGFLTAALGAFLWAQRDEARSGERRLGMALAWAACALAVMSKGLVGLVLPGGAIFLYLLASRDWRLLGRLHPVSGALIVLALCAPWFIAVSRANPEFAHFFFVHEHFQRFLTPVHRREAPWWYFLPLLLAGALPWTRLALRSLWGAWRLDRGAFQPRLFLLGWIAFTMLFFSASSSKLPSYILPVFPALAWLAGDRLARLPAASLRWDALLMAPLAIGALVLGFRLERWANERTTVEMYRGFEPWIIAAAVVALLAAIAAFGLARRDRRLAAATVLSLGSLAAWQCAFTGHDALSPSFSAAQIAAEVRPQLRPECPFYSVHAYDQTLPFYLGRTVTLVDFRDEMDFGLRQEPALAIATVSEWAARWRDSSCAYAFLEPDLFATLEASGLPMRALARDTRRVIVAHPALEPNPLP